MSKKLYMLMKPEHGSQSIKDRASKKEVGALSGSGNAWSVEVFGMEFTAKSKAKALGFVRGVFATKHMVDNCFPVD